MAVRIICHCELCWPGATTSNKPILYMFRPEQALFFQQNNIQIVMGKKVYYNILTGRVITNPSR